MQWCKLKVVTSKHEDCNLMFTNHRKEDKIYPLKIDSKAQNKDQRSIVTTCKNPCKGFVFSTYWGHNSGIQRWNLIISASLQDRAIRWYHCYLLHPSHQVSKRQQNSWSTEKVCTYHPVTSNLADLAKNKRHSQNMILYYQSCSWWLSKERYVYTSWGNTLLKAKTRQVLISCASPRLIQQ
jgi:hypothetical protein